MDKRHQYFSWHEADWRAVPGTDGEAATYVLTRTDGGEVAIVLIRYPEHFVVPVHHHGSDYCTLILEGSMTIGRRTFQVGDMRIAHAGVAYGPLRIGADGCTVIDFFADRASIPAVFSDPEDRGSLGADTESFT